MRPVVVLGAALLASASVLAQDAPVRPDTLRVCADPDNLPLSHADESGFENRIARLIAKDWGVPLTYAWMPDRRGFVRKTMGAGLCDVIIGVPVGFERTATTKPYYRSSYVLVERASRPQALASFDDSRLKKMRIGVQLIGNDMAASPPGYALARHGATSNVRGFVIPGDEPAAARMVHALERRELDAVFVWGPQAGWFAKNASVPMRVTRVAPPTDLPHELAFEYDIAMGVKHGNKALRDALQETLDRRRADIDRILADYGVPRVEAP